MKPETYTRDFFVKQGSLGGKSRKKMGGLFTSKTARAAAKARAEKSKLENSAPITPA